MRLPLMYNCIHKKYECVPGFDRTPKIISNVWTKSLSSLKHENENATLILFAPYFCIHQCFKQFLSRFEI